MNIDVSSASRRRRLPTIAALLLAAFSVIFGGTFLAQASTFPTVDGYLMQVCRAMGLESSAQNAEPVDQCLSFLSHKRIISVNTADAGEQGVTPVTPAQGGRQVLSVTPVQGGQQGITSFNAVQGGAQSVTSVNSAPGSQQHITAATAPQAVRLDHPLTRDFALEVSSNITQPRAPSFLSHTFVDSTFLAEHGAALEFVGAHEIHDGEPDPGDTFHGHAHEHQHHCPTPHHHHVPHQHDCPAEPN